MILVADSGSTKCDWLLIRDKDETETKTMGFNPFFHNHDLIVSELGKNETLTSSKNEVTAIFFYGAGCSSTARNTIVKNALSAFFTNATEILVDHDLTGAAVATCGTNAGIACILGTGSNSCYFDGFVISEKVPALGYILGDEGSGSYFGKILLSNFLYHKLPEVLEKGLVQEYGLTKEEIFNRVYNQPNSNVYLASFMRFISSHRANPFVKEMIYDGLTVFANIHITCYDNYKTTPVHFVGSIAYYFNEILEQVAQDLGFMLGKIVKKPVTALGEFHSLKLSKI